MKPRKFPEITETLLNEVYYRTESIQRCLDLFIKYSKLYKKNEYQHSEFASIKYISCRFAVLEFTALFDGTGNLSIKLHKRNNVYTSQKQSLEKFFPHYSSSQIIGLKEELDKILKKRSPLIFRALETRNEKLAHASVSKYHYRRKHLSSFRFPTANLYNAASDIQRLFGKIMFDLPPDYDFDENSDMYKNWPI